MERLLLEGTFLTMHSPRMHFLRSWFRESRSQNRVLRIAFSDPHSQKLVLRMHFYFSLPKSKKSEKWKKLGSGNFASFLRHCIHVFIVFYGEDWVRLPQLRAFWEWFFVVQKNEKMRFCIFEFRDFWSGFSLRHGSFPWWLFSLAAIVPRFLFSRSSFGNTHTWFLGIPLNARIRIVIPINS